MKYRELFHHLVGSSYLFGFISLYLQYDGLYGYNGIIPADLYVDRIRNHYMSMISNNHYMAMYQAIPSITIWYRELGVSVDAICNFLILIGLLCSSFICAGYYSSILYLLCFISYLSILSIGQVFLSFQWDSLLMEVGFICIFSSPIFYTKTINRNNSSMMDWVFRFLAFKLMFMSGCSKLQAFCPTWLRLSALEYHFSTQPLPTPLSWYFHNIPPIINRIAVAATLLIEIPFTFMLISPFSQIRSIGGYLQLALQFFIALTGNYSFFNILTAAIMVIVLIDTRDSVTIEKNVVIKIINSFDTVFLRRLQIIISMIYMYLSFNFMIKIHNIKDLEWFIGSRISLAIDYTHLEKYMLTACLFAVIVTILNIIGTTCLKIWIEMFLPKNIYIKTYNIITYLISQFIAIIMIVMSSRPFSTFINIDNYLLSNKYLELIINKISPKLENMHVFNGYGLFRRMTGVMSWDSVKNGPEKDVAIVARPEVVLEGLDPSTMTWKEIPFLYKPNIQINQRPSIIAPHQPRLDWQMWFLALGSYVNNPWVIHLIYKLLQPKKSFSNEVLQLLDYKKYPFRVKSPKAIRAVLYQLDFTRYNASWNRLVPDVEIIPNDEDRNGTKWWSIKNPIEVIPPLELENESLLQFLQHHNFPVNRKAKSKVKLCKNYNINSTNAIRTVGQSIICSSLQIKKIPKVHVVGFGYVNGCIFYCFFLTFIFLIIRIKNNQTKGSKKISNQPFKKMKIT